MNKIDMIHINMNKINASSLFHFTKSFATLKKIVTNGLRYSFAYEKYPEELVKAHLHPYLNTKNDLEIVNGVAIPMISFCDIPLTRASDHIDKYGHYMIGFDKANFSTCFKNTINPVIYVHSPNLKDALTKFGMEYAKASRELFKILTDKENLPRFFNKTSQEFLILDKLKREIDPALEIRFLSNFLIGLVKPIEDENHYFYDEREWRLFLPENTNDIEWKWSISENDYESNKVSWNESLGKNSDLYIQIPCECYDEYITHIVVSNEEEIDELIQLIMDNDTILGYENDSEYSRMKLISKITSLERIEKDF